DAVHTPGTTGSARQPRRPDRARRLQGRWIGWQGNVRGPVPVAPGLWRIAYKEAFRTCARGGRYVGGPVHGAGGWRHTGSVRKRVARPTRSGVVVRAGLWRTGLQGKFDGKNPQALGQVRAD